MRLPLVSQTQRTSERLVSAPPFCPSPLFHRQENVRGLDLLHLSVPFHYITDAEDIRGSCLLSSPSVPFHYITDAEDIRGSCLLSSPSVPFHYITDAEDIRCLCLLTPSVLPKPLFWHA